MTMSTMENLNQLNKGIGQLRMQILDLMYNESRRCANLDTVLLAQVEKRRISVENLARRRNREVKRVYSARGKRLIIMLPATNPIEDILSLPKLKVATIIIGKNSTTFKMVPTWFKLNDESKALRDIVYPSGVTEHRPFNTVARYRSAINQSNNFRKQPVQVSEDSTETLVLALDAFVQHFGGQLTFTNDDLSFEESTHHTSCGVTNLGSAHLLANEHVLSARYGLIVDLDYDDLAKSEETMQTFILTFADAVAKDLACDNDYVRVTSVQKSTKAKGKAEVNLVLTTPDKSKTRELANALQDHARFSFSDKTILRHVQRDEYQCKWMPVLSYLQLQPMDFDSRYNLDYAKPGFPEQQTRGNLPYYLPIGWYRHGLKVDNKYKDSSVWLGSSNSPGEWPVAFHGTRSNAVKSITDKGLITSSIKRDAMLTEAIAQMGILVNQPGLYVATHCNGGSHPYYTEKFDVQSSPDKIEGFQVVFQCRVRPDTFTRHTAPVKEGEAWRLIDPEAVRPDGILLKNANKKLPCEEE